MIRIRVKLFSIYSDIVDETIIELDEGSTLEDLVFKLLIYYPELRDVFEKVKPIILVNGFSTEFNTLLKNGDEIALIPPSSGG